MVRSADMAARARREILSMTESGAALVIPVYTLDQYAAAILRRAGGRPRSRPIGELECEIAIGRLLKERGGLGQLAALGHSADRPGVARAFASAITEMKQAAATPEQVEQALRGGTAPAGVHADFLAVWRGYEDFLQAHGLADGEDLYGDAARALRAQGRQALGDPERVWFDQFFNVTPAEAALISAVACLVPATCVSLACAQCDDADSVVERVRRLVEPAAVEVSRCGGPGRIAAGTDASGSHSTPELSIMTAPGPAAEAREVAREVKRLIVEEGRSPWEICIASADSAEFIPALLEAFEEFGVPCAAPRKRLLSSSMPVLDCVALADATASRHSGFDLLRLLASPYIGRGPTCAAQAARAIGVKGLELTAGRWKARLRGIDECGDALALVETLAEAWSGDFGKSGGLADRVCEFIALLAAVGMPGSIMATDNRDWAVESWAAWKALNSLLDEIARSVHGQDASDSSSGDWAEFARILGSAIRRRSFPLECPDSAGVKVVGPARGAELEWPVLFLSGMAEGTFPRRMRRPWVFKEDDLERLARSGIGVTLPGEHAAMERFIFSSAVGAASERLYITYPSSAADGSSVRRSFFVDELLDSMGVSAEDERKITVSVSPRDVFPRTLDMTASPRELALCALALARTHGQAHEQAAQLMPEVREWARQRPDMWEVVSRWKDRSVEALGPGFSVFSGAVGAPDLVNSLKTKMLCGAVWSAGHFDDYLRCPFAFFCSRVLQLGAVEEAPDEPTPLTRGGVLHDILRRFFERRLGSCLVPSKIDDYHSEMLIIAQEELDKVDIEATSMSGPAWEAYRNSIIAQAIQTLDAQVELAGKTDGFWSPAHLEWSFGLALRPEAAPSSVREYLLLSSDGLGRDRTAAQGDAENEPGGIGGLRVCGRVDRIDVGPDGALAIYDYKSGRSANLPKFIEIKEADEVQLGVYVLAVERLLASVSQPVAGAWYYSLRDSSMGSGVWREEYHDRFAAERRRGGKLSGEEWREYVGRVQVRALEVAGKAAAGVFHIAPRKPSSCVWCDYRRVCQVYMLDLEALSQSGEGDRDVCTGGGSRG